MNEQLVTELLEALKAQTEAQKKQTEAINRLANSNESLCKLIMQTLAEEVEEDNLPQQTYLSDRKVR
ncbi:TPA: hypothetical protein N5L20_002716 [Enterobacter kobei]|uniref:hypothetical protein n=1 Tax=Enterobacter sp. MGH 22 TaxID=1329826 RepID=UPI0003BE6916|nr:hypothetical protein [Enterobacter sp. MGH 22]ESN24902.1 hypothetical protein L368_01816 [Enterobacter sp. MGH 22]HCM9273905.1 hypothetical protein [Enterobacter kobei]